MADAPLPVSAEYTVTVDGRPVFMHTLVGMAGGSAAFATFDADFARGPVTVRVRSASQVDAVSVHPLARGIPCRLEGREAVFAIDRPGPLFVQWNEGFELPVYLFANAPEADPRDPRVIHFGPGLHDAGVIRLASGQTLHLAEGARVTGTVLARDAHDIRVCGRGILCGSHHPFGFMDEDTTELAGFKRCQNVTVEGVTLLDSFGWTLVFYDCDRVHVDNVKILGERLFSTDGINPVNCRDVLIEGCFVRCKDDCVSVKGLNDPARCPIDRTPIRGIEVRDCVFWSDNNNGVVLGSETWASSIADVAFRNIDFLKTSNTCGDVAAALSVIALHDTAIDRVTFEDIRIEHATGPIFNLIMPDVIFGNIHGWRGGGGAHLRDVVFRRVAVLGGRPKASFWHGRDPARLIENPRLEACAWMGRPVATLADARIETNAFVHGATVTA